MQLNDKISLGTKIGSEAKGEQWFSEFRTNQNACFSMKVSKHLWTYEGKIQRIDVFETPEFGRVLTLDGLLMITERDEFMYHEMLVHVPMFTHPNPRRVLIIGGGDGGSLREVLRHPTVEEAVLVEIDENVIEAARKFFPSTSCGMNDPRSKIVISEGGEYVKNHPSSFDVIIIDSTDPTKGAGGLLFTVDFYSNCKKALISGGVMSAETENVFYDPSHWEMGFGRIRKVFSIAKPYWGMMTTYPSGCWTYTFASEGIDPVKNYRRNDAEKMVSNLKYYNPQIHIACFALPEFMNQMVKKLPV